MTETRSVTEVTLAQPDPLAARSAASILAARLPLIVFEARRIAALLSAGLHGRGRAGPGETFWQYRNFTSGESASRIDWRRSARHDTTYFVREREWEATHTVYLWMDRSASMQFCSDRADQSKGDRALIIGLALADLLVRSGESVALLGLTRPTTTRRVIDLFAEALMAHPAHPQDELPATALPARSEVILISDFLAPKDEISRRVASLSSLGAKGHLMRMMDPAEVLFPFTGETELVGVEEEGVLDIGDAQAFRQSYLDRMSAHENDLRTIAHQKGWTTYQHITNSAASEALRPLLMRMAAP